MEALTSLGINGKMLIAQIVNFLVLLFILNRLLYKPIIKMFDERREKIEKGLKDAEAGHEALAQAEAEAEKIKEQAYKEANEIISNSRSEAEAEAKAIVAEAHKHGEKIMKGIKEESENIKQNALKDAKSEIAGLISISLNKIVHNKLDESTRERLTKEAVKEIQ